MGKYFLLIFFLIVTCKLNAQQKSLKAARKATAFPSFRVNFPPTTAENYHLNPTSDKPQSKLWFMDSCWWALLPDTTGPTLWQRTQDGWKEHPEINDELKGIPGRADVWYGNRVATAVSVSDSSLYIFELKPETGADTRWQANILGRLSTPQKNPDIETATIAQDAKGTWWVAADVGKDNNPKKAIYIWYSKDDTHWSSPILIQKGVGFDDISCITALKHSVLVLWSDQERDAITYRKHINGQPASTWTPAKAVAAGEKTADDHINTALSTDGTLWAATKNSVDKIGRPQLVLRVHAPNGKWKNYPYLLRWQTTGPSRPIITTTPDARLVLAGHTLYQKTAKNRQADRIVFGIIDTTSTRILVNKTTVIAPDSSLHARVNNITGPKHTFPRNAPWLILASDRKGNVYEADLRSFFHKKNTLNYYGSLLLRKRIDFCLAHNVEG